MNKTRRIAVLVAALIATAVYAASTTTPYSSNTRARLPQTQIDGPTKVVIDGGMTNNYALYITKGADMSGGTQSIGICFGGDPPADGVSCTDPSRSGYLNFQSDNRMHFNNGISSDTVGTTFQWAGPIIASGTSSYFQSGIATASLPACNSGSNGALVYDTTVSRYKQCLGGSSTWQSLTAGYSQWTSHCTTGMACETSTASPHLGVYQPEIVTTIGNVTCNYQTAGVVGGGTGLLVMEIVDSTGASLCTGNLGLCSQTALTAYSWSCNQPVVVGRTYRMQYAASSNCSTLPINVMCTSTVVQD